MKKHYEVVCAVIKKDSKYFICQRGPKGECGNKWEFPGGKIEKGETHQQALIREIKEELNSTIKVNKFILTVNHEYNTFFITMHAYLCDLLEGDLEISEHINKSFISKEEFNNYDLAEADLPIVEKI